MTYFPPSNRNPPRALNRYCPEFMPDQTWGREKEKLAFTVLNMDISGTFDLVLKSSFVHILNTNVYQNQSSVRSQASCQLDNVLTFNNLRGLPPIQISHRILQDSPESPILWLFYQSELLDILENHNVTIMALGFADDTTIIVYGLSTLHTNNFVQSLHMSYIQWEQWHGAFLSLENHSLLHFKQRRGNQEWYRTLQQREHNVHPSTAVRILSIIVIIVDNNSYWTSFRISSTLKSWLKRIQKSIPVNRVNMGVGTLIVPANTPWW